MANVGLTVHKVTKITVSENEAVNSCCYRMIKIEDVEGNTVEVVVFSNKKHEEIPLIEHYMDE